MKAINLTLIYISILSVIFFSGCELLDQNSGKSLTESEIFIQTDQEKYSLTPDENQGIPTFSDQKISVTLRNESSRSVFMAFPSFFATLEIKENNKWQNLGSWYAILGLAPSVHIIEEGEEFSPIIELSLNNDIISSTGIYRFNFEIYSDSIAVDENLLPLSNRVSNTFEIID